MKILYGVQGTGHGHISRAKVLLPKLRELAEVDVLISGYNFKMDLDGPVQYKARGMSFTYDNQGSIDLLDTAFRLKPVQFLQDVQKLPVNGYDFVVSDFEPVTAWAANLAKVPCIGVSHQAAFLSSGTPRPRRRSLLAEGVIKHFAPQSSVIGFHFRRYDDFIEPPIIRDPVKRITPTVGGHVTVYLPAFDNHSLCSIFSELKEVEWHVFSPDCQHSYQKGNVLVRPVGKERYLESLQNCLGVLCSAGFEAPSEAMYLGKKLLVIPIKNQYEQLCNAAALDELGVDVAYRVDASFISLLNRWLREGKELDLPEICNEDEIAGKIIAAGSKKQVEAAA